MSDWEIIHKNTDRDGELVSFLVLEDGEPTKKNAIPENELLYLHGLKDFLVGDGMLQFDENLYVKSHETEGYMIINNGDLVEVPPSKNTEFLEAIADIIEDDATPNALRDLHADIISGQVRRKIVNNCVHKFGEKRDDIVIQSNGWIIDDIFLIDWNANIYTKDDDPEEGDYIREFGSGVTKTDTSYEAISLDTRRNNVPDNETVQIGSSKYTLTDTEMEFLAKVMWIFGRWKYHPDEAFWLEIEDYYNYNES